MKKYLFLIVAFLFTGVGMILAQVGEGSEIPDIQYLIANFGELMLTFAGIAAVSTFVAEFFIRLLKTTKKAVKIVFVMVLGVGLTFLSGLIFKEGDYALMIWWQKIFWGLLSGATAAGLRGGNLLFIKSVVEYVIGLLLKKEPVE